MELTFTLDLEEHRPDDRWPKRYDWVTRKILDFLDQRDIRATVFVLGKLAETDPDLIRDIAGRGHELAYHTYSHVHLTRESPGTFRQRARDCKALLEDLGSQAVAGFRAPAFSLTRATPWVPEVLGELGFVYSSSILPANNPINGFPGAPRQPFRWPNGLLEIPAPVAHLGPLVLPYLGGIYLRYLPIALIRFFLRQETGSQSLWMYCHPHDFDHGEAYFTIPGTSPLTSVLLWMNRKNTFKKLERIMADDDIRFGDPFIRQIESGRYAACETFNPAS